MFTRNFLQNTVILHHGTSELKGKSTPEQREDNVTEVTNVTFVNFCNRVNVEITCALIALKLIKTFWMVFVVEQFIWDKNNIIGCSLE